MSLDDLYPNSFDETGTIREFLLGVLKPKEIDELRAMCARIQKDGVVNWMCADGNATLLARFVESDIRQHKRTLKQMSSREREFFVLRALIFLDWAEIVMGVASQIDFAENYPPWLMISQAARLYSTIDWENWNPWPFDDESPFHNDD